MQGKIKNINKKHPKKALIEPQWKNCRVTEAAFRGTVVFPVSEVLLTCQVHLCVRLGVSIRPVLLMVIVTPIPSPHHVGTDASVSREHHLLLFLLPLLFLSTYHSLSFYASLSLSFLLQYSSLKDLVRRGTGLIPENMYELKVNGTGLVGMKLW